MLEKTTLRLGPSAVRHIWPSFKNSQKRQSSLFVKCYETKDSENSLFLAQEAENFNKLLVATHFDFLYPTLSSYLTRQAKEIEFYRKGRSVSRSSLGIKNYRHYSSDLASQNLWEISSKGNETELNQQNDITALLRKLGLSESNSTREIWEGFQKIGKNDQNIFRKALLSYLHNSSQVSNSMKIVELFENLEWHQKDVRMCEYAIQAYLRQQHLSKALEISEFSLEHLKVPVGHHHILSYAIRNQLWSLAFKTWKEDKSLQLDFNFYRFVGDSAPEISEVLSLSKWVNQIKEKQISTKESQFNDIIDFSTVIIEKALHRAKFSTEDEYFSLLRSISDWEPFNRDIYTSTIVHLSKLKKESLLLKSYNVIRLNHNYYLSQTALLHVLRLSCDLHDVLYIKYVLDDFFSLHSKPSRAAYRMCLKEFSRKGDVKTVYALFKQYINRYKSNTIETLQKTRHEVSLRSKFDKSGRSYKFEDIDEAAPLTANDFAPLLHVHAKRGEVEELEKIFNQIKFTHGLEPDALCWNIRFSAYMKIRDIDRAFRCFEEILDNPNLKPDHYTIGTMMGILASRADLEGAKDVYAIAKEMNIPPSVVMVNCLTTCLVRNDKYIEAEILCNESCNMFPTKSNTQIWNSLVMGYVLKRDLPNVNRILKLMSEKDVEYDQFTYSALMQAFAITKHPYLAARVLSEVMPQVGIKPNIFHFAVLLGGYLLVKDWNCFYKLHQQIMESNTRPSASTRLLVLKAAASEDAILFENGTVEQKLGRSLKIFSEITASLNPQDIADTARKGFGQAPLDVMYPAIFYSFMAYILSENGEFKVASELLNEYKSWLPENRKDIGEIMKIITAIMSTMHASRDRDNVKNYWQKAVSLAKEESKALKNIPKVKSMGEIPEDDVGYFHQLSLNKPFAIFMRSLMAEKKAKELNETVQSLVSYGFDLDNHNWNEYIKYLARNSTYYKLAFQLCEIKLMPGWRGWRIQRRKYIGRRSNIPLQIRRVKLDPRSFRPFFDTLLWLARRLIDLRARAAENPQVGKLLNLLKNEYPKTIQAIDGIPRADDESILKSNNFQFEL